MKAIKILGEDRMSSARNSESFAARFVIIIIHFKWTVIGDVIGNYVVIERVFCHVFGKNNGSFNR